MKQVELWTDGACSGNPGPGGWAAILRYGHHVQEISGGETHTTNNRMEIMAVVAGLSMLTEPCRVTVMADSAYVIDAHTKNWIEGWVRRGWRTTSGAPVKNRDLWEQLIAETGRHDVHWHKVKGHAGVTLNERADRLAVAQRDAHARHQPG